MPRLLFFSLFVLLQLLFEGGIFSFGKLADINNGRVKYVHVMQLGLEG